MVCFLRLNRNVGAVDRVAPVILVSRRREVQLLVVSVTTKLEKSVGIL